MKEAIKHNFHNMLSLGWTPGYHFSALTTEYTAWQCCSTCVYCLWMSYLQLFLIRDFITVGTRLNFTGVGEERTRSSTNILIIIIDDDIAESREIFICTLLGGSFDSVQGIEPNLVTVEIHDDGEHDVCYSFWCTYTVNMIC